MDYNVFELGSSGITKIDSTTLFELEKDKSTIYVVHVNATDRMLIKNDLVEFGLQPDITEYIQSPFEHIRFYYYKETLYGEMAFFSSEVMEEQYTSFIIRKNVLIVIHPNNANIFTNLNKTLQSFKESQQNKISLEIILYSIILETLSNYGKLILSYRDEIEDLAQEMDKKGSALSTKDIWQSKTESTTFLRVLDKLYYTLSFPPTKAFIDAESPYLKSFEYLIKNLSLLKASLNQVENRLDSLNDHYQLILQSKSNQRLKVLTIIQAIFVPITLVAGIYGMNFKYMPELDFQYGYFVSLGVMVIFILLSLFFFYKKGWFKD